MSFSDDDLKRLKESMAEIIDGLPVMSVNIGEKAMNAFVARLEAAENGIEIANKCRMGAIPIEDFVRAYEAWLRAKGEKS